jgi:hypothetical protein
MRRSLMIQTSRTAILAALVTAILAGALLPQAFAEDEGIVSNKKLNFEIRTPPDSIDWEVVEIGEANAKQGCKAHLNTSWADSDPPAAADVYVWVKKLSKEDARMGIDFVHKRWRALEAVVENPRNRTEEKVKWGGVDSWAVDVTGNHATYGGVYRLQYVVGMNGNFLYAMTIYRSYDAVDDEDIDEELQQIRDSFKFYEIRKVTADKRAPAKAGEDVPDAGGEGVAPSEEKIPPEKLVRRELKEEFWKFDMVKPEGLLMVPSGKLSDNERQLGVVKKMERRKGQTYCQIRIYAKSLKSGQKIYTIKQLAESRIKAFEKTYKKTMRKKPAIDKKWRIKKMSDKSMAIKLIGRRAVPEITWWYFADCKNGRQYQLQIYVTGGTGEKDWAPQLKDFMEGFKPFK